LRLLKLKYPNIREGVVVGTSFISVTLALKSFGRDLARSLKPELVPCVSSLSNLDVITRRRRQFTIYHSPRPNPKNKPLPVPVLYFLFSPRPDICIYVHTFTSMRVCIGVFLMCLPHKFRNITRLMKSRRLEAGPQQFMDRPNFKSDRIVSKAD